jgi:hypothetical protein
VCRQRLYWYLALIVHSICILKNKKTDLAPLVQSHKMTKHRTDGLANSIYLLFSTAAQAARLN